MREVRRRFHEELRTLGVEVQRTGAQARLLLEQALHALARGDPAVCDEVIRGVDQVDRLYLDDSADGKAGPNGGVAYGACLIDTGLLSHPRIERCCSSAAVAVRHLDCRSRHVTKEPQ